MVFLRLENYDFWGLGGPGGPRNPSKRPWASPKDFWKGILGPQGSKCYTNLNNIARGFHFRRTLQRQVTHVSADENKTKKKHPKHITYLSTTDSNVTFKKQSATLSAPSSAQKVFKKCSNQNSCQKGAQKVLKLERLPGACRGAL